VKPLTNGRILSKNDLSAFGSGTAVTVEEGSGLHKIYQRGLQFTFALR
jgi:hypothetical protein